MAKCERCDGTGKAIGSDRPFEGSGQGDYPGLCPACKGTCTEPKDSAKECFSVGLDCIEGIESVPACPRCRHDVILHVHTPAYPDLHQTHMSGSERFCCEKCKYTLTREEAVARGFKYVLDIK